jgi:hypothetical protein
MPRHTWNSYAGLKDPTLGRVRYSTKNIPSSYTWEELVPDTSHDLILNLYLGIARGPRS